MSDIDIENLGLNADQVHRTASFWLGYGNLCYSEAEQTGNTYMDKVRRENDAWNPKLAEAASAFRQAGQWELLNDTEAGVESLVRAGQIYETLAMPYGTLLLAACGPEALSGSILLSDINQEIIAQDFREPNYANFNATNEPANNLTRVPQQLVYGTLALVSSEYFYDQRVLMPRFLEASNGRYATPPVGALGLPASWYWTFVSALTNKQDSSGIQRRLEPFMNRYIQSLQMARRNRHLWLNCASAIEVVDIEILMLITLTVRLTGKIDIDSRELQPIVRIAKELAYRG